MKKTLLSLSLLFSFGFVQGQNLYSENFDTQPAGWSNLDNSTASDISRWDKGSAVRLDHVNPDFSATFLGVGYDGAGSADTVSNWMFAPSLSLQNGDVISFYARTATGPTSGTKTYPDRFQMLIGQGDTPADPVGETGLGGYSVVVDINPLYIKSTSLGFPTTWTKYSYTVTGIPTETACTIAFRYFIDNATNKGDYIGLDTVSVDRTLGTEDFFMNNFSIAPNPANEVFNLTAKNGTSIENIKVIDINGRIVNEMTVSNLNEVQVNISDLTAGVYFVKVQSESGVGTSKIVKK